MSNISWQLILCEMIGSSSFLPLYCPSPSVSPVVTTGQFPVSEGRCLLGREEAFTTYQPWASLAGSLFCLASLGSMRWASIKYMLIRINCAWSEALGEPRREVMGRGASFGNLRFGYWGFWSTRWPTSFSRCFTCSTIFPDSQPISPCTSLRQVSLSIHSSVSSYSIYPPFLQSTISFICLPLIPYIYSHILYQFDHLNHSPPYQFNHSAHSVHGTIVPFHRLSFILLVVSLAVPKLLCLIRSYWLAFTFISFALGD